MTTDPTPSDLVKRAVAQALAMTDPAQRAREITAILDHLSVQNGRGRELRDARRQDVEALNRSWRTLEDVGKIIGLTKQRIGQILKGK
jgi:DNA-directed RNA polymerase sigma subunit (sigma70/sigma32)